MQEACQAQLAAAGFAQYEVSAYARSDRQCRHNLNYWQFGDYLGIGAGAHGKLTLGAQQQVRRRWKIRHPLLYLEKAGTDAAIGGDEPLTEARLPFDFMLNALRLNAGVPLALFEARTGLPRSTIADRLATARARALAGGRPRLAAPHRTRPPLHQRRGGPVP
ncbi:hypothetical protein LJB71_03535 [Thermomonas sp. S9]|nr:hypothetical protein [Thermomonas sp. S9]